MLRWDPAFVVCFSATCDSRPIRAHDGHLVGRIDFLGTAGGAFSTLTTLTASGFLWEQGCNPGIVDEVKGAEEDGKEEEV